MELQQPKCRADTQNRKGFSLHHFCVNTACWPKTMQVSLAAGFFVACQTTQQHLGHSSHAPGAGEAPSGPESPSVKVSAARSVSFLCPHTTPSWGGGGGGGLTSAGERALLVGPEPERPEGTASKVGATGFLGPQPPGSPSSCFPLNIQHHLIVSSPRLTPASWRVFLRWRAEVVKKEGELKSPICQAPFWKKGTLQSGRISQEPFPALWREESAQGPRAGGAPRRCYL